jgi:hypothetical protein
LGDATDHQTSDTIIDTSMSSIVILFLILAILAAAYFYLRPRIASFCAISPVPLNGKTAFTAVFKNGTGSVDQNIGVLQSDLPKESGPISASATYTLTVSSWLGKTTAQTAIEVIGPPLQPAITVSPDALTSSTSGYVATVQSQSGCTFDWIIAGATITQGAGTRQITFDTGAAGALTLQCVARNSVGLYSDPGLYHGIIAAKPWLPSNEVKISVESDNPTALVGEEGMLWDMNANTGFIQTASHGGDGSVRASISVKATWSTPCTISQVNVLARQTTYGGNYKQSTREYRLYLQVGENWVLVDQKLPALDGQGSNTTYSEDQSLSLGTSWQNVTGVWVDLVGFAYSYEGDRQQIVSLGVIELQIYK